MIIIGVDFHPAFQQIAFADTATGEFQQRRLLHREEAEKSYRDLAAQEGRCGWGWKPVDMRAGLNDCWRS